MITNLSEGNICQGERPVLDLCPATNLTGLEIIVVCEIVHYSACTSVLKQRAALTGATKSRETYFIAPELSESFSFVIYPALYTFPVSEHVVFCSEIPCSSLGDFCIEHAQFKKHLFFLLAANSVRATWNTVPGSSFLYVIPHKKGFAAKKSPLSISLTARAHSTFDWHLCISNDFHGFVKQNLGDNSVAVNSLGKDLQLSYFQSRGSTVLMAVQVLLLR